MIEVVNLTRRVVNKNKIVKKTEQVLLGEKVKNWDISICLTSCGKIKELNKKYRGKDCSTDVLSFGNLEVRGSQNKQGEIFACLTEVAKNAKNNKQGFQKELDWALVHSVLHLLGYDHESSAREAEEMSKKELRYLNV